MTAENASPPPEEGANSGREPKRSKQDAPAVKPRAPGSGLEPDDVLPGLEVQRQLAGEDLQDDEAAAKPDLPKQENPANVVDGEDHPTTTGRDVDRVEQAQRIRTKHPEPVAEDGLPVIGQLARHIAQGERLYRDVETLFTDKAEFADGLSRLLHSVGLALEAPAGGGLGCLLYRDDRFCLAVLSPAGEEFSIEPIDIRSLRTVELPRSRRVAFDSMLCSARVNFDAGFKAVFAELTTVANHQRAQAKRVLQRYLKELHRDQPLASHEDKRAFADELSSLLDDLGLRVECSCGAPTRLRFGPSGNSDGTFIFAHGNHTSTVSIPDMKVVDAPPDRRTRRGRRDRK